MGSVRSPENQNLNRKDCIMTESQFIQEALHLKEKTYGLEVSLDRMRKALEFLSSKLQNKNDDEAWRIYKQYWFQYRNDFHVFKNLSQIEIYQLVKKRDTARNLCIDLMKICGKLAELVNLISKWDGKIRSFFQAMDLCKRVQAESQKKSAVTDARRQIEEMRKGKNDMTRVFNGVDAIARGMHVRGISDFISVYTQIFNELGKFCDKIADYSLKIVDETEKSLGAKSGLMKSLNEPNSAINLRGKAIILLNRD